MSNIQSQKSGLARLMATENLTVQHAKTHTASFDPKNRILTVPIWEKTSSELYDLLVGHEVGHAIDTPADGWHGAVHKRGANYKGFLNVVEDARIEKRQKRRYPGLRRSFVVGFGELMGRDFFGLKGRDINNMTFIDRLNVYSKSGYTLDNIQFNKKEQDYVRRVQLLETWDDVLKLTNEIWDYSKDEQAQLNLPQDYQFQSSDEDDDGDNEIKQNNFLPALPHLTEVATHEISKRSAYVKIHDGIARHYAFHAKFCSKFFGKCNKNSNHKPDGNTYGYTA